MNKLVPELQRVGYELAEEVRSGKWRNFVTSPVRVISNPELLREFKLRCPGHAESDYQNALARGLHDSR